jgi:uncharacterized LabA/DUF88 family protein
MPDSNSSSVAVLIDYENVFIGFGKKIKPPEPINWEAVLDSLKRYGSLMVCKAYADWSGNKTMQKRFSRMGVEAVTVPSKRNSRNSADVRIAVDAIDVLVVKNNSISTLVLLSGDGDFTALVNYLKGYGKFVVGIGIQGSTAEYLESACHEYRYLGRNSELVDADQKAVTEPKEPQPAAAEPGRTADQGEDQPDKAQDTGNPIDPVVREYLEILHRKGIRMMPNGDRQLIIQKLFKLLKENPGKRLDEIQNEIMNYFEKNHPGIDKEQVNNSIQQISDANCLQFDKHLTGFAKPLPRSERQVFLRSYFATSSSLMRIMDTYLLDLIKSETGRKEINCEALSTVLYGTAREPELVQRARRLLDRTT